MVDGEQGVERNVLLVLKALSNLHPVPSSGAERM